MSKNKLVLLCLVEQYTNFKKYLRWFNIFCECSVCLSPSYLPQVCSKIRDVVGHVTVLFTHTP